MATQVTFLTFWARPTSTVVDVNNVKSEEYRYDENPSKLRIVFLKKYWVDALKP